MKRLALIAGIVFAGAAVTPAALLFSQLPSATSPSDGYFSDGVSTGGSQFYSQTFADNFSLSQSATITTIRFWGSSENFIFDDLTNFSAWDVYIYDTAFNVLSSAQVPKATFTITPTGSLNSVSGIEYMMELSTSVALGAGNYILHVGSINSAPGDDAWAWSAGVTGDNSQYFTRFDAAGWQTIAGDGAFELEGQPVPEPASMIALGLGASALIARRRRKLA